MLGGCTVQDGVEASGKGLGLGLGALAFGPSGLVAPKNTAREAQAPAETRHAETNDSLFGGSKLRFRV